MIVVTGAAIGIYLGASIATLVVSVPGMPVTRIPLIAAEDVAEAGFFGRIGSAFRALVLKK